MLVQQDLFHCTAPDTIASFNDRIADCFESPSLIVNDYYDTDMSTKKEVKPSRRTSIGDAVDCYRNLLRPSFFSIKQKQGELKNKVSGYARAIVIKNPNFRVGEGSRQRVNREGQRNVHAYVSGQVVEMFDSPVNISKLTDFVRVSYNPFKHGFFFTLERDPQGNMIEYTIKELTSHNYPYAIISGGDVILTDF